MESTIVHIDDAAFQSLLIASIETFPSSYLRNKTRTGKPLTQHHVESPEGEAFGLLFGQRLYRLQTEQLVYNVTLAVPMQTAKRKKDTVSASLLHFGRIREVTESFPNLEFLGTFHSHPCPYKDYDGEGISMFSDADEATACQIAREYGDEIVEVILGITALQRHSKRDANVDCETIQSYCGRFKYSLSAYVTTNTADDDEFEIDEENEFEVEFDEDDREATDDEDSDDVDETEEQDDDESEEEDDVLEPCLNPVDRLICPLAAHGGGIFSRAELGD